MNQASMWMSCVPQRLEISRPGMNCRPAAEADRAASVRPEVVSWSVRDTASSPASAARCITSAGANWPSERSECACKSTPPVAGAFSIAKAEGQWAVELAHISRITVTLILPG